MLYSYERFSRRSNANCSPQFIILPFLLLVGPFKAEACFTS
jgi:hypothetical protein